MTAMLARKLEQYFGTRESLLGERSAFRDGFSSGSADYDEAMLRRLFHEKGGELGETRHAVRASIDFGRALRKAADVDARAPQVLFLAFGPTVWPVQIEDAFGRYTGVTLVTETARMFDPESPGRWLSSIVARQDRKRIRIVRNEANLLTQKALVLFSEALSEREHRAPT